MKTRSAQLASLGLLVIVLTISSGIEVATDFTHPPNVATTHTTIQNSPAAASSRSEDRAKSADRDYVRDQSSSKAQLGDVGSNLEPCIIRPVWVVDLRLENSSSRVQLGGNPRLNVIINASSVTPLLGVYGWQFGIDYDESSFIPTVVFGSDTIKGSANWDGLRNLSVAFSIVQVLTRENIGDRISSARLMVGFTLLNPQLPATLSANTLLAKVAFDPIGTVDSEQSFSITDVMFVDRYGVTLPRVLAGKPVLLAPGDDNGFRYDKIDARDDNATLACPRYRPPVAASYTLAWYRTYEIGVLVVGENETFDGSASYAVDSRIVRWEWDFGDGTRIVTSPHIISSHYYSAPGNYTVVLTVVDDYNLKGSTSATIRVFQTRPPLILFSGNLRVGENVSFSINPILCSSVQCTSHDLVWFFGDGTWLFREAGCTTCQYVSHVYKTPGNYTVELGADSSAYSGSIIIQIKP